MSACDPRRSEAIDGIRAAILVGPPLTHDVIEHGQDAVGHLFRPTRSSARARRAPRSPPWSVLAAGFGRCTQASPKRWSTPLPCLAMRHRRGARRMRQASVRGAGAVADPRQGQPKRATGRSIWPTPLPRGRLEAPGSLGSGVGPVPLGTSRQGGQHARPCGHLQGQARDR